MRSLVAARPALRSFSAVPEFLLTAPATSVSELSNGVCVASEASPSRARRRSSPRFGLISPLPTFRPCFDALLPLQASAGDLATVGVFVGTGSRFEAPAMSGASHLLQTAAMKEKAAAIDALGGSVSGYTTRETTVYTATVLKEKAADAVKLLGELATKPPSGDQSFADAKSGVLAQLDVMATTPEVMEGLHEMAYMDTSLATPVIGTKATVEGLVKSDLKPSLTGSMVKVAGAGVDHAMLSELAKGALGSLPAATAGVELAMEPAMFTGSDKCVRMDSYPFAHVAIAYEGPSLTSEYALPAQLAHYLLGSYSGTSTVPLANHATRLQIDLGEQDAAAAFTPFYTPYKDTGLFGIYLVSPDNKLQDAVWYVMMNLVRLMYKTTDEELDRAKLAMKTAILESLSTPSGVCEDLGKQMLSYGRVISTAELFARIDAIDAATIKDTVYQIVHDNDHVLSAAGPIWELPDYNYIRRRSYWLTR